MGKSKKQQKLSNLECASFCSQMTMVLHAGFPAVEGVSLLLEDAKDVQEKAILQVMYDEMINTGLLYPALEKKTAPTLPSSPAPVYFRIIFFRWLR